MLLLCGLPTMVFIRFRRIRPRASVVPPSTSISMYTPGVVKVSLSACPQHAWRIFFLATVSLESLSPFFAARACAVAVWNAIMFVLDATDMATLAADWASIIVRMIDIMSGLVGAPPCRAVVPLSTWRRLPVTTLGEPPPLSLLFGGLLIGTVTAVLLVCPPNTLEKSLMVGGQSSSASSGAGRSLQAFFAHFSVVFVITIRFHLDDMVLTGCSSSLAERQAWAMLWAR